VTAADTARTVDLRALGRAARTPVIIALVVLVVAVLVSALTDRATPGYLDPQAPNDQGSRAVAALLTDRAVTVEDVRASAGLRVDPDSTVLVPFPDRLYPAQLEQLRASGADVVLVAPGQDVLDLLAPDIDVASTGESVQTREPGCALPAATRAGPAELGGTAFTAPLTCYDGSLAQLTGNDRTITALGSPDLLFNQDLAVQGNAALALGLLGEHPRLVWFRPLPEPPPAGGRPLVELLPPGWPAGAVQLAVAALLLALWRVRRLGPVVTEPLPVVVRAAETDEGRARLYRAGGARGHAAQALRSAAATRLAPLLGMPTRTDPAVLARSVAARTGRPGTEVADALHGLPPTDDAGLIALADTLDRYEAEVRRT
jgi:hypothetical protein